MNILIVPDSFKGSLSSNEVCNAIYEGINKEHNEIRMYPFSDGGEGFSKCFSYYHDCLEHKIRVENIYGDIIPVTYISFDKTAVIECAQASGLLDKKNIMKASSFGTGQMINDAINNGYQKIILSLGGTGCCDGGIGVIQALGANIKLNNQKVNKKILARDLQSITDISTKDMPKNIEFIYACDVENPYLGINGAARIFAPQKGANKEQVITLEKGLTNINSLLPKNINSISGTGAAGGICGILYSIYGGEIKSGFDTLCETSNLKNQIEWSDLVITGEGKTDKQTIMGKLPYRVIELSKKYNKKTVLISGSIEDVKLADINISLVDDNTTVEYAIKNAYELIKSKVSLILK